ncbi:HNH endonuclease [Cytobacillus sp. FSL H8-0458]|uniref:HNH endonuclease n=1 Tax=Cytobacillus sp. FSL H8-0458 TaxID=2975346 RepID=UPI0030F8266B
MKPYAEKFYKSKRWQRCRNAYFVSQHGLCERCGLGGDIVHHTVYLTPENINDPLISLNHELLELLCRDCHNKEHFWKEPLVDGLMFNEHGELVQKARDY